MDTHTGEAPAAPPIDPDAPSDIPVIDLAPFRAGEPGALEVLSRELKHALEQVGFYFLAGHGVEQDLIDGAYQAARQFHGQPLERKLALRMNAVRPGYQPFRSSTTRHSAVEDAPNKANLVEAYFVRAELPEDHPDVTAGLPFRGRNQWPEGLPGFREAVTRYIFAMQALGKSLLPAYALALDLPPDWFDAAFAEPISTLRLSRYPAQAVVDEGEFGIAPHTDTNFMTFLPPNPVAGLAIRLRNGRWVEAPSLPDALLVNSGDLLRRWTNDRFLSTPHRVTSRPGVERYAAPFFMDAGYHWPIACIPTCQDTDNPPRYPPITFPEYMTRYRARNYG